ATLLKLIDTAGKYGSKLLMPVFVGALVAVVLDRVGALELGDLSGPALWACVVAFVLLLISRVGVEAARRRDQRESALKQREYDSKLRRKLDSCDDAQRALILEVRRVRSLYLPVSPVSDARIVMADVLCDERLLVRLPGERLFRLSACRVYRLPEDVARIVDG